MKKKDATMSLIGHLAELRKRLAYCLISTVLIFVFWFIKYDGLMSFLLAPLIKIGHTKLVTMSVAEGFLVHVKVAGFFALVLNFPIYAIQIYLFVLPAIRLKKSSIIFIFLSFILMFILGAMFFYSHIFPNALRFFLKYKEASSYLEVNIRLSDYISFALYCMLGFGIVFQAPMLLMVMAKNKLISSDGMRKFRRFAIPILFFIAAVVTPPDVMSQVVLGVVLMFFYEVTILGIKIIESRFAKKKEKVKITYTKTNVRKKQRH